MTIKQFGFRLPDEMKEKLSALAKSHQRSLGAEIRVMLELALKEYTETEEMVSKLNK